MTTIEHIQSSGGSPSNGPSENEDRVHRIALLEARARNARLREEAALRALEASSAQLELLEARSGNSNAGVNVTVSENISSLHAADPTPATTSHIPILPELIPPRGGLFFDREPRTPVNRLPRRGAGQFNMSPQTAWWNDHDDEQQLRTEVRHVADSRDIRIRELEARLARAQESEPAGPETGPGYI